MNKKTLTSLIIFLFMIFSLIESVDLARAQSLSVQEPRAKVYPEHTISLIFDYTLPTYERASVSLGGFAYSLDGKQVYFTPTIEGSTCKATISGLSEGNHTLIVFLYIDIAGTDPFPYYYRETVRSDLIEFSIRDVTEPKIQVLSTDPISLRTYNCSEVPLVFSVNEATSWIGYQVDDKAIITVAGNTTFAVSSEGTHSIVVYANDTWGNMGQSLPAYFRVALPQTSPTSEATLTAAPTCAKTTQDNSPLATGPEPAEDTPRQALDPYWIAAGLIAVAVLGLLVWLRKRKQLNITV